MKYAGFGAILACAVFSCFVSAGQTGSPGDLSSGAKPVSVQPLPNAHAHNDYQHKRPLLDALDHGFTSVEADVFLVKGTFYVYHDLPARLDKERTLEKLYLKPLKERIRDNGGQVYPGYDRFFYLMIDFKSDGKAAYQELKKLLSKYESIISVLRDDQYETRLPVKVFISGSRPDPEQILQDDLRFAALDGRPADLGLDIHPGLMPVISDHYRNFLSWKGEGPVDPKELENLRRMVGQAHAEGKKVRLWAAPDKPEVWSFLLAQGVDLINTDKLPELRDFLLQRNK